MAALTAVHVAISLVAIITGFIVLYGMLTNQRYAGWNAIFLLTTVFTNATGFLFKFEKLLPSHVIAGLSLVILAVAIYALYCKHLAGAWRCVYVITATIAFYFNFFVLIVQSFLKVPSLKAFAPNQSEPPFAIAQGVALLAFIVLACWPRRSFIRKLPPA